MFLVCHNCETLVEVKGGEAINFLECDCRKSAIPNSWKQEQVW